MPQSVSDSALSFPDHIYTGPKHIPIESIIDLRHRGLSVSQIAKVLGINNATVSRRIKSVSDSIDITKKYVNHRAFILAHEQNRIRQHITDAKLAKASARDLIVSFGILYDKERLETGQSTSNIAYADMVKARDKAKAELDAITTSSSGD